MEIRAASCSAHQIPVSPSALVGFQERLVMAIRSNFLFHMLPEDELGLVLRAFEARELVPGDVIIQQVRPGHTSGPPLP